jgi:hypothetical protein
VFSKDSDALGSSLGYSAVCIISRLVGTSTEQKEEQQVSHEKLEE